MKRVANYGWVAILVLSIEAAQLIAAEQRSPVPLDRFEFEAEHAACSVFLTHDDQWMGELSCSTARTYTDNVEKRVEAAVMWLLLADGRAAIPVDGPRVAFGISTLGGVGHSFNGHTAFENVRDPVALVLKFDDKLHIFPISNVVPTSSTPP